MEENQTTEVTDTQDSANTVEDTQQKQDVTATQEPEKRKFKLKVNGSQREFDEDAVRAFAQKGLGADQKFQKAAEYRKQVQRLAKLAKEDPDSLLRQLTGQDPEQIYKSRLSKRLQELSLDPKEKELREYKKKIEQYEKKQAELKAAQEKERETKATQFWTQKYDKELPDAIKAAGLPLTQDVIRATVDIMIANLEQGLDLPYSAVMQIVKDKYTSSVKNFLTATQKDKLIDLLGQDVAQALIQAKQKKTQKSAPKMSIQKSAEQKTTKTLKQAERELDQRIKEWAKQG